MITKGPNEDQSLCERAANQDHLFEIQANPSNATADSRRNFGRVRRFSRVRWVFHNGKHRKAVAFFCGRVSGVWLRRGLSVLSHEYETRLFLQVIAEFSLRSYIFIVSVNSVYLGLPEI